MENLYSGDLSDTVQLLLVGTTALAVTPFLLIAVTCFPLIVIVFAILRQAIGLQQSPPNMFLITIALFLTYFVMEPVFATAIDDGFTPFFNGDITLGEAIRSGLAPFHAFMANRVDPVAIQELQALRSDGEQQNLRPEEASFSLLIPSFLLSEVGKAFQIGFLIFMPFLIIDLVVSAILMSMGMMMVPPVVVSLPFKLAFFVVSDGWTLIASALVRNYQ
ncbi:MAG: flagellar type III secretion system pore protein FliP [Pseudomonadota bacterium]